MSPTIYLWLRAIHLFGVLMWLGNVFALVHITTAHAAADLGARPAFLKLERASAIMMDIGATIAIATGVYLFVSVPGLMKVGAMHAKLTLVIAVVLALHIVLRVKVRRFREGNVVALPPFIPPLLSLTVLAIIILVIVKPF